MNSLGSAAAQLSIADDRSKLASSSSSAAPSTSSAARKTARVQKVSGADAVQALPLRVRQAAGFVGGHGDDGEDKGRWTQVLIHEYAESILVLVSQLGKVGCLTQVTMHRRPSHYSGPGPSRLHDFDIENDDIEQANASKNAKNSSSTSAVDDDTMALLSSSTQQRLLGSHAPGQRALYALYNVSIAARATRVLAARMPGADADIAEQDLSQLQGKSVVVGLALAPSSSTVTASGADADDLSDDDDFASLADEERLRFHGILDLVSQARHPSVS